MIEPVSLTISIAQLLLDIYNTLSGLPKQRNDSTKLNQLKHLIGQLGQISSILREAKKIHDQFETSSVSIQDRIERINETRNTDEIARHVRAILDEIDKKVVDTKLAYSLSVETSPDLYTLPDATREGVTHLPSHSQKLQLSLNSFNDNQSNLRDFFNEENFGKKFESCLEEINLSIKDILLSADKVIFYTAPMLIDFNAQLYNTLSNT